KMLAARLARSVSRRRVATHSIRYLATSPLPPPPPSSPPKNPPLKDVPPPPPPSKPQQPLSPSSLPSLDFSPEVEGERQREQTGARSSKGSLSSSERRRRNMVRAAMGVLLVGAAVEAWVMGNDWEEEELKAKKIVRKREDVPTTRWGRTKARFTSLFDFFTEPLWPELLPPPHPAIPQKPYTLLVSVDDLLVTSTWDRQHGWRTAKRPGVDYFLGYLSQFFEIVIFTTQYNYTAAPIVDKLDPYQFFVSYRLYRDACRSVKGTPVKDLTYLNRDLSKVVVLDVHPEHVSAQPDNAIILPKWTGDPKDRGLVAMIPFLESIGIFKPADVRPILEAYRGKDIPIEYAKKEAEMKRKHVEDWEHKKRGLSTETFTLSGLFGGSSRANASPIPPTYLELKRREAQLQYKEEQAYIEANKETFERLIKEDQEAQMRQMSGSTIWSAAQTMFGLPPP
ncbi:HAD-like protein, partial [Laetiporus sulphureus 93-53]